MPELSRFYGIIIYMYFEDHAPPHFHAKYSNEEVLIEIKTGEIYQGSLPTRALKMVREWLDLHREELLKQWDEAVKCNPIQKIEPLK